MGNGGTEAAREGDVPPYMYVDGRFSVHALAFRRSAEDDEEDDAAIMCA